MTVYLLIGVSWLLVGVALVALWLVKERDPEVQWRLLLAAAVAPFVLFPVASVCRVALARVGALLPGFDSLWPLAILSGAGAVAAAGRVGLLLRRQRALVAASRTPEDEIGRRLDAHLAELSRAAGLRRLPRVLVYPRGGSACVVGQCMPTIVVAQSLLAALSEPELRAVLAHEIAHIRRRDNLLNWLGVILRATLFYLPPWSVARGSLTEARERRADRLAATYTGDPLALASALIKVWRHTSPRRAALAAVGLLSCPGGLEARVRCLLEPKGGAQGRRTWLAVGLLVVGGLVLVQTLAEGGTHLLARVSPAVAAWEECCDAKVSPVPHCVPPRATFFFRMSTTACSSDAAA